MRYPDLAATFKLVAEKGKQGFYAGRVAESIVDLVKSQGGVMEVGDLEAHHSTAIKPIQYTYHETTLYECPPNGQGITALMALGIIEGMR